jgi:DNA glycosylase AlkZ-like
LSASLVLTRAQILAYRRRVGVLDERLPMSAESLRRAAWAGLQDSSPRSALLQIHARVADTTPTTWEHPSLAQVWGPMFSDYVVPAEDAALFTLGRMPSDGKRRQRAIEMAERLEVFLAGRTMAYGQAGHAMGIDPNMLRYGTTTGRLRIRWEGARQPLVWMVPAPEISRDEARRELIRRYLHVFAPATAASFVRWAGIRSSRPEEEFEPLSAELMPVRTPVGDEWILAEDEPAFRAPPTAPAAARLLPSGDTYWLRWDADRELLVPDAALRAQVWTPRVWPGALQVEGEIVGTWRRANEKVDIQAGRTLSAAERDAVESEALSMPLPGLAGRMVVRWLP